MKLIGGTAQAPGPGAGDRRTHLAVYTDAFEWGGAEMALDTLIGGLDRRIEVTVLGTDREIVERVASARPDTPIRLLPRVRNKWDARASLAHLREIRRLRPDVLKASLRTPWSCQYALTAGILTPGVKTVALQHVSSPPEKRSQVVLNRLNFKRLDAHIAVSRATAAKIEAWASLPPQSIRVIYHGVANPAPAPVPVPRVSEGPVIGSVGRLNYQKGYEFLLHALALIPDAALVLVGDGEERGALERLASELGIAERVTFAGWHADPRPWLPSFDVFAIPSRWEGLPAVGIEAMFAGLPVVATRVDGIPEAVVDGKTGTLVPPEDPKALAEALVALLADPARRREMGELARRRAEETFNLKTWIRAWESLYAELLGGRAWTARR